MRSVIVRSNETVKRIVVLIGHPCFELIALCVQPFCKCGTDFVNLGIRHLYGFHIPYLDFLIINKDFFCNIGSGIYECVFEKSNSVKRSAFGFNSIFIPYMHIFLITFYIEIITAFSIMDAYICIEKM